MLQVFFRSCLCWWRRSTWLSARTCLCSPSERTRPPEIAGSCPARFGSTPPAHHFGDHHLMNGDNHYLIILSSTFLGNTNDDLSIRREHCLKVALFHRVGQVGNVEVRRILFRLASHLCLWYRVSKKWLTEFSGLYSEAKTFGNLAILTNFGLFGRPHLGFYHTAPVWPSVAKLALLVLSGFGQFWIFLVILGVLRLLLAFFIY